MLFSCVEPGGRAGGLKNIDVLAQAAQILQQQGRKSKAIAAIAQRLGANALGASQEWPPAQVIRGDPDVPDVLDLTISNRGS